jgi:flagellar basal body-associated protein FliL
MKSRLKALAIIFLLCGLATGGLGVWMYYSALRQAESGMSQQKRSLELYDQSDAVKDTPEENRLIEEGQRYEQSGNATLASARSSRLWALTSGIASIIFILASIATMMLHVKKKEADSAS